MNRMISPLRIGHFFQERLQPVLEFAAELRARDHRADVHRDQFLVLERLRHVAGNDAARETFDDRRLADPGSPIRTGLFFVRRESTCMTRRISLSRPMTGIDLAPPRQLGQVASVFLQRLIFALGILIGHALRTSHLLQRLHQLVARHAEPPSSARAAGTFAVR